MDTAESSRVVWFGAASHEVRAVDQHGLVYKRGVETLLKYINMNTSTTLNVKCSELTVEVYFGKASCVPMSAKLHLYSDSGRRKRTALEDVRSITVT